MCSTLYKTYNDISIPVNVQCLFTKQNKVYIHLEQSVNMYTNVSVQI